MTNLPKDAVMIQSYANRIANFETEAGESFVDYFMDDNVFFTSWAFWLVGKGYLQRGNMIVNEINARGGPRGWSDQEFVFGINTSPIVVDEGIGAYCEELEDFNLLNTAQELDYRLWAEFLISTDRYFKPFTDFLENFEAGNSY